MWSKLFFILIILIELVHSEDSSYDSLISSQCKAKCLSMYPWNFDLNTNGATEQILLNDEDISRSKRDESSAKSLWASFLPNKAKKKKLRVSF